MNSLPQLPGYVPSPNSAPDSLLPSHLSLPLLGELVEDGALVLVALGLEVVEVRSVVAAAPGTHWLYQSFW